MIRREVLRHRRLTHALRPLVRFARAFNRPTGQSAGGSRRYPETFRVQHTPALIPAEWPEPPAIENPFRAEVSPQPVGEPVPFDVALFEALNAEKLAPN